MSQDPVLDGGRLSVLGSTRPPADAPWRDRLAFAISAAASPYVVLPVYAAILTAHYTKSWTVLLWWGFLAVFFSTGIPFLYIAASTRRGRITDLHVMHREHRLLPFAVSLASSATGALALYLAGAPLPLVVVGIAILANGIVFALVTLRWKISMHPSVLTATTLAATILVDTRYAAVLLVVPAVVWARVRRARHNIAQGVMAVILAAAITLGVLWAFGFVGSPEQLPGTA